MTNICLRQKVANFLIKFGLLQVLCFMIMVILWAESRYFSSMEDYTIPVVLGIWLMLIFVQMIVGKAIMPRLWSLDELL